MSVPTLNEIELGEFDIVSFMTETESNDSTPQEIEVCNKRQIIFAIDASNSMQGYKIGAVNDCVNNVLSKLRSVARRKDSDICVSVIGFASRLFRWTNGFIPADDFKYSYVEMVDGLTDVNALLEELIALTETSMDMESKKFVVLFSDGLSTEEYSSSIERWSKTKQYNVISKIIVAFEDDLRDPQSMDFFRSFTDKGLIISVKEQEKLLSTLLN